ncbi:adaptor protein MecA [Enterococcus sp. BWR-S5]|uniref:adaptor protein MecA n=1 Tax=Enterococcus sp. BWR-S5 TaxID=2787714 RepID=UPI001920C831|nr:adaptor protein MecA [Enterococcus sp. BWR-S5]MBL1225341.1 adaptor protein MecA [Enterococcus sp. BWR-S5]
MEMEHINENTIRVLIGNEDLADRGITFLDLLGNHKEVENFFYSILEEVDIEDEFQGSEAVTFQVLPKSDGLELFISKNASVEDVPNIGSFNDLSSDEASAMIRKQLEANYTDETKDLIDDSIRSYVLELDSFESMVQLANEIYVKSMLANLYKYKDKYFLQVMFFLDEVSVTEIENEWSRLLEFGHQSSVTPEVLNEYGSCIMERNAIELTRYYFH